MKRQETQERENTMSEQETMQEQETKETQDVSQAETQEQETQEQETAKIDIVETANKVAKKYGDKVHNIGKSTTFPQGANEVAPNWGKKWNDKQNKVLETDFANKVPLKLTAKKLGRSYVSCWKQRQNLRLTGHMHGKDRAQSVKTEKQDAIIKEYDASTVIVKASMYKDDKKQGRINDDGLYGTWNNGKDKETPKSKSKESKSKETLTKETTQQETTQETMQQSTQETA